MADKNGCLKCHFLCLTERGPDGWETNSVKGEHRDRDAIAVLIKRLDVHIRILTCFRGNWDAKKIGVKNTAEIEGTVFMKDRGKRCALFSLYDSHAAPEAVKERDDKRLEVTDRRFTRILAVTALIISAVSLAVQLLRGFC